MDEEEEAKTEFCSNCRRDIPAANFVMHVTHCQRNLTLCKECGEPVPTSQQEEHFEEYHAKVKCDCGELVEKMNLEEHKEEDCPNRGVECQYCELTLPFNKMTSHVEYCSSRTEKCDICDRFIQMKDLTEHVNTGCQYPPLKEESKKLPSNPPRDFFSEMPVGMLHAMGLIDSSVSGTDTDYFHPFHAAMHEFGQIINTGLGTSPFGDPRMQYPSGAAYFGGISAGNGVIDGSDVIARGAKRGREFPKPEFDPRISQDFDKVDDDEYTQDIDDDEMLAAAYQADAFDSVSGNVNDMSSAMVDEAFPYMKSTLMADSVNDADKTQLPCEFCGDLFPVDILILHQSGCQLSSLDSLPGSASHFPDDSVKHNLPRLNNSTITMNGKFQTNHTELETKARKRSEDDTFLPCEFCQELFPFENLIAHQAVCEACPASRPTSALDGSTSGPPLNNARPQVRNGSTSRPSRPVYESKKAQKAMTSFIPSELDDGDDLDFTPNVNDNSTTRDLSRKAEKYSDRRTEGHDISPMNNELPRQDRRAANHRVMPRQAVLRNNDRAANHQSMPGQAVLRNNDLANRQPNKDALRVKNKTADQLGKRQPEPRLSTHGSSYKAPTAKPLEDGLSQKKLNAGSRSKPTAEVAKKPIRTWLSDSATGSQPRQPSTNDEIERYRRAPDHKVSQRSEARASKPRRTDNGSLKSDPPPALRVDASRSSRTKASDSLPPISKPVSHNGTSSAPPNPRRNSSSSAENGILPNRGGPRPQGSVDSHARPSNTTPPPPPRKPPSTRKKIV